MKKRTEIMLRKRLSDMEVLNRKINVERVVISTLKRKLVEEPNYSGIVYIIRFLDYKSRNTLFLRFIERHPEDYLFVLAFADAEFQSYKLAEQHADTAYEQNIYAINDDILKEKDRCLCLFLNDNEDTESLQYVYDMVEKYEWMESYKVVTSKMIDLGM